MKRIALYVLSALFVVAGFTHFLMPQVYVRIVPPWMPNAKATVFWSGVAELVLGITLLIKPARYAAALGIILLLIAIIPANVKMADDWIQAERSIAWIAVARLPLQAVLIWCVWKVRKV